MLKVVFNLTPKRNHKQVSIFVELVYKYYNLKLQIEIKLRFFLSISIQFMT